MPAYGRALDVAITDVAGAPLADAVVWAIGPGSGPTRTARAAVQQINKTFVPGVTVVQTGTAVSFPNRDTVRHHVYSFSPAKVFETKLFVGEEVPPVVFDKPGVVVLGCNIHDTMVAQVVVVDTPWFAKSGADGAARIALPAGRYQVFHWHPRMKGSPAAQDVTVGSDDAVALALRIDVTRSQVASR
jgi:plastocyanin